MHNLILLGVPLAPSSWPSLALDFTSFEPWLLICSGIAAGWVCGRYFHLQKYEQEHGAGRDARNSS